MYGTMAKLHLNTNITRSLGEDTKRGGKGRGGGKPTGAIQLKQ